MIARADDGGLGNLTWEFARALRPDRVLVMDLGEHGRSDVRLERYDGLDVRVAVGWAPSPEDRSWLLDGCDVLYSAETWYADEIPAEARKRRIWTVLHVMPELFKASCVADEIWIPTPYRREHMPASAKVVPVPVATDRFDAQLRSPAKHFVHVCAPAMLDRNGTSYVLAALAHVTEPIRLTILGAQDPLTTEPGNPVTLDCVPRPYPRDYFDIWPDDADCLLLPRRYAGLSMPVQEAAARGMFAVMTAVVPQTTWPGVAGIPSRGRAQIRMAGGQVDVHDPDPVQLAATINRLAADADYAADLSTRSLRWAEALSWDAWAPRYRDLLGLD